MSQSQRGQSDSREGFRLIIPHRDGCEEAGNPAPFVVHGGTKSGLNNLGKASGAWTFHRFLCNDPDCDALMLVRIDVLANWIGNGRSPHNV